MTLTHSFIYYTLGHVRPVHAGWRRGKLRRDDGERWNCIDSLHFNIVARNKSAPSNDIQLRAHFSLSPPFELFAAAAETKSGKKSIYFYCPGSGFDFPLTDRIEISMVEPGQRQRYLKSVFIHSILSVECTFMSMKVMTYDSMKQICELIHFDYRRFRNCQRLTWLSRRLFHFVSTCPQGFMEWIEMTISMSRSLRSSKWVHSRNDGKQMEASQHNCNIYMAINSNELTR